MTSFSRINDNESPKRMLNIFISSTAEDLETHRTRLINAVQRSGHHPSYMETFGARPDQPVEGCRKLIKKSDAVIVIVAYRYGYVPDRDEGGDDKHSMTWLEVKAAEEFNKPVFAFLVDEKAPWTKMREENLLNEVLEDVEASQRILSNMRSLREFKKYLEKKCMRDKFRSEDDLAEKAISSLSRWINEEFGLRTSIPASDAVSETEILEGYLNKLLPETRWIDIRGISAERGSSKDMWRFPIEELFTPLKTTGFANKAGGFKPDMEKRRPDDMPLKTEEQDQRPELSDFLKDNRKLLLIGAPGGGKTTFLRLISCVLAKDLLGEKHGFTQPGRSVHLGLHLTDEPPVPVFIRLALLASYMNKDDDVPCNDHISRILNLFQKLYGEQTRDILEKRLNEGRCALLLDGLDEVADTDMRCRITNLVDEILQKWGENLVIVTSRPHGYKEVEGLKGVVKLEIDEFNEKDTAEFLNKWVNVIYSEQDMESRNSYHQELEAAIGSSRNIRRMARNPVMLTCLCVVHWNERKLPEGKADLMSAVLRWLVDVRKEQRKNEGYTNTFAEECFKSLALGMTNHPGGKKSVVDIAWAAEQLAKPFHTEQGIDDLETVRRKGSHILESEMIFSGIIERVGLGQLRFWHLTFQEHYAARRISELSDLDDETGWWPLIKPHIYDQQWFELLDHFAGCLSRKGREKLNLLVERFLNDCDDSDLASVAKTVGILGRLLRVLEEYEYTPPPQLGWEKARERVMEIFKVEGAKKVKIKQRITAAEALGQSGDPRLELRERKKNFRPIPGLEKIKLGIYPVTVEEYKAFVEDDGYRKQDFWGEYWRIREKNEWNAPDNWERQLDKPNRPVVYVSWYEAKAYCRWRSKTERREYRLPAEKEWEAAAVNPDGPYPWGKEEPNNELANYYFAGPRETTPVGVYPAGATPEGHLDMAGNVWEWCEDDVTKEYKGDRPLRALRGGCFWLDAVCLRSTDRDWLEADYRSDDLGFRLVVAASTVDV